MKRVSASGDREVSLAIALIGPLVVLAALWVPIRLSAQDSDWAGATVLEKFVTDRGNEPPVTVEHLRYAFVVDGREFAGSSEVREATYARTTVGDPIAVRFAGGDPSVNRYVADYFVTLNEAVLSLVSLFVTGWIQVAWWRSRMASRRQRAPRARG